MLLAPAPLAFPTLPAPLPLSSFVREPQTDLLTFIRRVGTSNMRKIPDATVAFISDHPFAHVLPCTGIMVFRPSPAAQRYIRGWWDNDQPRFNCASLL